MENEAMIHIHHKWILFVVLRRQSLFIECKTMDTLLRALK